MSYEYSYAQALNAVSRTQPAIIEDQYATLACNMATSLIWDATDWRESTAVLPPFYLQPGEQDHGPPLGIVPSDFMGVRRAQVQMYNGQVLGELAVSQNLNEVYWLGLPSSISYENQKAAFRLYPRVPYGYGAPNYFVSGTYKRKAVQITNATLEAKLPLDDKYFQIWIEALRWAYYVLRGDPKAGRIQMQNGQTFYEGQIAIAKNFIAEAVAVQETNEGEHRIHPARPLVAPRIRGW